MEHPTLERRPSDMRRSPSGLKASCVRTGLIALCLFGIACGEPSEPRSGDLAPETPYAGTWRLMDGGGPEGEVRVVDGYRITLTVSGGEVGGTSACNTYGGPLDSDDDSFDVKGGLSMTEMGCNPKVMEAEASYLAALGDVDTASRDGDTLTLTGPDTELLFEFQPPVPVAELTDTDWHLESLLEGTGNEASGWSAAAPAELLLRSDGTLSVTTGCQELEGEWSQRADEIMLPLLSSKNRCGPNASPELREQDIHVSGVIGDGFTFDLEGQTLTVFSMGGRGLQYSAKPGE